MQTRSSSRTWLTVVVILVIAGIAAYFVGGAVERGTSSQAVVAAQQRTANVQSKLNSAQAQIAAVQSVNHLLSANVWTYRAAVALDNRNFGVANDAVSKAAANLGAVDATAAGVNAEAMTSLKKEAAGIKISVAINLETQRDQLLHLATDIDTIVTAATRKAAVQQ